MFNYSFSPSYSVLIHLSAVLKKPAPINVIFLHAFKRYQLQTHSR